ncbi:MAG: cobalt transporter CbiM [Chloroflexi bacterium]|nr:cobalt transporter CbiM [Chloroflexota bacterium]
MHIPDGYLSPATAVVMYGAAAPFWYQAVGKVKEVLKSRAAPFVAVFAAFCFVIQMLNIPVPGGTTAHAVGSVLMAIVLGPWAAVIGGSTALIIQAFFFGDGGITAIGANCFNMAIAMPFVGYAVYRLLAGRLPSVRRRTIAAAIGAYIGVNVAALLTALELGLQPVFWSEGGKALYNPYGLGVTIPAMMTVHLTIIGIAEAAVTGAAIAYLARRHSEIFEDGWAAKGKSLALGKMGWALVGILGALVIATPLGLIGTGSADFEWAAEQLKGMVGYVPSGLSSMGTVWRFAPLPDYTLPTLGANSGFLEQSLAYILSAVVGVSLLFVVFFATRIILNRRANRNAT